MPVTASIVKTYVFEFCEKNNIPNSFNKSKLAAGRYWFQRFLNRHPEISIRKAQAMNPGRAIKLNKHIVEDYFNKLKVVMENNDFFRKPRCRYNMDEKGCRLTLHHQQSVLAQRGAKRVHLVAPEHAQNVTVVACGNAAGAAIPPMIIYKGKRCKPEYADNLPPDTFVRMSEKGNMITKLFIEWLDHFSKFKTAGTVLLIFDGATSHISPRIVDVASSNDIILFCLPSNTTHELQSMDKCIFRLFEHFWDQEVLKYWRTHPDRVITKSRFGHLCTPAYNQALTISNITSGFCATGIYPFNPAAIPEAAFAPSLVTEEKPSTSILAVESAKEDFFTSAAGVASADSENVDDSDAVMVAGTSNLEYTSDSRSVDISNAVMVAGVSNPATAQDVADMLSINFGVEESPLNDNQQPLSDNSVIVSPKVSFSELMVTPKVTKRKIIRKKSLTSKAQVLSKELFSDKGSTTSSATSSYKKAKKRKKSAANKNKATSDVSWYCPACEKDTALSMRMCKKCNEWYHEECVGLDSDNNEDFFRVDCEYVTM